MGFGMPSEGRVTIDGIPLRDIHPQGPGRNVMWIEPNGPIWDGTIQENICGRDASINTRDVVEALEEVDVYERLQRLPEGLNTIVSPGDSMLSEETTYAMAVARALLHKPPIVLALEPPPPAEHLAEDPCLQGFAKVASTRELGDDFAASTANAASADRVVLLNGPRLVGEGKHADLLANSDLYRHLNYLLFNPYRHQKPERSSRVSSAGDSRRVETAVLRADVVPRPELADRSTTFRSPLKRSSTNSRIILTNFGTGFPQSRHGQMGSRSRDSRGGFFIQVKHALPCDR